MKKLRMEIEELRVETFDVQKLPEDKGTVHGHASLYLWCQYTYDRYNIQCHSVDGCDPTQYFNDTCDPSGPRPCSCPADTTL
jgi:hypothetical protein